MAFESLSSRLQMAFRRVTGRGKLTENDIKNYLAKTYGGIVTKIPDLHNFENPISYNNSNGTIVFETQYMFYIFKDFEMTSFSKAMQAKLSTTNQKSWLIFMNEKFGNEYKMAFHKMRENNKKNELKNFEEKYDKKTKELENLL